VNNRQKLDYLASCSFHFPERSPREYRNRTGATRIEEESEPDRSAAADIDRPTALYKIDGEPDIARE
jgi:hypothetical protein